MRKVTAPETAEKPVRERRRDAATETPANRRVVLVGRPNVGKSALFNRLIGARRSLVHDRPGMTRDVLEANAKTAAGGVYRLVDTGGLDMDASGGFAGWTSDRALAAVADADVLLFVIDGAAGLLPEDERIGRKLHALGKPVVVAWNKADTKEARARETEASRMGFENAVLVSALHGIGTMELEEALERALPPDLDPETRIDPLSVAVVGRPNVGKSSLVNALAGQDRVMVSEIAGTTRDAIDVLLERDRRQWLLVDTAGIRRKGRAIDAPEILSVIAARKAMERARLAIVVFDAEEGITAQDATVAGYAEEAGRGIVLVANKWDLIEGDPARAETLRMDAARRFAFAGRAPFLAVSCRTGRGVSRVLREADALAKRYAMKMSTGELNRLLHKAIERQTPKGKSGRDLRIRYAVQVAADPPLIRLFADRSEHLHFSTERYLENRLREKWSLDGVPVRFVVRHAD